MARKPSNPVQSSEQVQEDTENQKVSARELGVMGPSALFIDTFSVTSWRGHMRIAFAEEGVSGREYWRTAIVMQTYDIKRLVRRLQETLDKLDAKENEATTESASDLPDE